MAENLIPISKAAEILNISIATLRRWDKKGSLKSIRLNGVTGHRYYNQKSLELLKINMFTEARNWVDNPNPFTPNEDFYCPDSVIFQVRLSKFEDLLKQLSGLEEEFSLITSIVGEIGNNSFDHNIGSWPDIRGILFCYDLNKRQIILADRGQGILATLKRVKPNLTTDKEALKLAFTEKISGRAPENRGNGLKFVKRVITQSAQKISIELLFQTGKAELSLKKGDAELKISEPQKPFRGCLALITF